MYENDFKTTKCKIEKLLRQLFSLLNCSFCFMAKARDIKDTHKITGKRYLNEKANKKVAKLLFFFEKIIVYKRLFFHLFIFSFVERR